MIRCRQCGTILNDSAKFCSTCGISLLNTMMVLSELHFDGKTHDQNYQHYSTQNTSKLDMGYPPPSFGSQYSKNINSPSIKEALYELFVFLRCKPLKLWGISLLYILLCFLAIVLGVLPIISIPIILVLSVGKASIFLDGYRGNEINPDQLFLGFKNFLHFFCGMAWMVLWIFIWALIPVIGLVFAVFKAYSYRFVPYILLSQPNISASDALRKSMSQTKGYCGKMFGADIIILACISSALLLLYILSFIPYMGIIFRTLNTLVIVAVCIFSPIVFGIIKAYFYDKIIIKHEDEI